MVVYYRDVATHLYFLILMRINFGQYYFSPSWLQIISTLLLFPILISLGVWQLERAAYKRLLEAEYTQRTHVTPIDFNQLIKTTTDVNYYATKFTGHFDNQHQFLLDNKFYNHEIGYQVLTPFILNNNKKTLLVNRGWIPQGANREQLPSIKNINSTITLQGIITLPETKDWILGQEIETAVWPHRIEKIDLAQISTTSRHDFYPLVILLGSQQPYGFIREWAPFTGKITMHYGYAFQWFALAATLLIIIIAINIHRQEPDTYDTSYR